MTGAEQQFEITSVMVGDVEITREELLTLAMWKRKGVSINRRGVLTIEENFNWEDADEMNHFVPQYRYEVTHNMPETGLQTLPSLLPEEEYTKQAEEIAMGVMRQDPQPHDIDEWERKMIERNNDKRSPSAE